MDKEILEILKAMQNQMNDMQDQMSGMQNQMNGMQSQIDGTRNQMSSMQNQMNDMHTDIKSIKETQKEHGDILKQLNSFEKNTQLAHERIDAKLKR